MGGGAHYVASAMAHLRADVVVIVKADSLDSGFVRAAVPPSPFVALHCVPGEATTVFTLDYEEERCLVRVDALGDVWSVREVETALAEYASSSTAIHVAPNFREDFPVEALRLLADDRCLSLDGQALVRRRELGRHDLDSAFNPLILEAVTILKCNEEEADAVVRGAGVPSLEDLGVPEVLITRGARGATLIAGGRRTDIDGMPVSVEDPTSAGDFFAAAYMAARVRCLSPAEAANFANRFASAMLHRRVMARGG
jgi:sugar/nucleoside kinase (ribokinase family)